MISKSIEERFWDKVKKNHDCWEWKGSSYLGYGQIWRNGKKVKAHRLSWEMHNGIIPEGIFVLHKCDNPSCVNPEHLFLGNQKDNMQDCSKKKRNCMQVYPGAFGHRKGEKHRGAKLSNSDVQEIVILFGSNKYTKAELARMFKVHRTTVSKIFEGKNWKSVVCAEEVER